MINVSKLKKGIVLDHITAGHGYKLFKQLHLDELEDVVVLMKNVDSGKLGKKDLIKIETDMPLDLTVSDLSSPASPSPTLRTANVPASSSSGFRKRLTGYSPVRIPVVSQT